MEKAELVTSLTELIDRYAQHRQYIDRAKAQIGKFAPAVVEKVINDHSAKALTVADLVRPLLPELASHIAALEADRSGVEASKGGVDEQLQELDLRLAIGEMTEEEFEKESSELRSSVDSASSKIAEVDAALGELTALRDRWVGFNPDEVVAAPPAPPAPPEPVAPPAAAPEVVVEEEPAADSLIEEPTAEPEAMHVEEELFGAGVDIREDVSSIFADEPVAHQEEEIAIETSEIAEEAGDSPSADVPFGFDDDAGDIDLVVQEPASNEVEVDFGGDAAVNTPDTGPKADEAQRRALLLYQEGTAEEQIYPFTGDALTIGRGRENDIQIKNDSKVSRYHCKLFRRGNSFYIEDIKSSNGTLVNGELITDRRLFGGEEIIIGETFFRFRIME